MNKKWETYNPQWLVEIAKRHIPDKIEIIQALEKCIQARAKSKAYIHFVDNEKPNQSGAEWQIEENIILEDEEYGTIVLDVLKGNRIGGVEFLKHLT